MAQRILMRPRQHSKMRCLDTPHVQHKALGQASDRERLTRIWPSRGQWNMFLQQKACTSLNEQCSLSEWLPEVRMGEHLGGGPHLWPNCEGGT